ncbi:DKNYY domain-containing protein [Dyadobacter sp. CY326]|uniref:DKNYY domain-containing protein n=1 Tax=Dyadobacter sp. CY326 TaxID=2907300 RepID=UPI001F4066D7|nr:DKNYY domain-containing protein [Dyadobacter sp. CY326]MCE7068061.1 DKNYY domain-containing protein [Dyadobacter sp. CY326]
MINLSDLAARISKTGKSKNAREKSAGYHIIRNKIYHCAGATNPGLHLVSGADPLSFEALSENLARDCGHVYFAHKPLSDDPDHFVEIDQHLSKDSQHVFYADRIISDDAPNFQLIEKIDSLTYCKDKHSIFVNGARCEGPDVTSFEPLQHGYARDCINVYLMGHASFKTIEGADPDSFQVINQYCSFDKKHVYWRGLRLTDCEPSTYEALNGKHFPVKGL